MHNYSVNTLLVFYIRPSAIRVRKKKSQWSSPPQQSHQRLAIAVVLLYFLHELSHEFPRHFAASAQPLDVIYDILSTNHQKLFIPSKSIITPTGDE